MKSRHKQKKRRNLKQRKNATHQEYNKGEGLEVEEQRKIIQIVYGKVLHNEFEYKLLDYKWLLKQQKMRLKPRGMVFRKFLRRTSSI